MRVFQSSKLLVAILCVAPLCGQDDAAAAPKAPDPQIAKDVKEFTACIMDKAASKDDGAKSYMSKWVQGFETMHPKDQTAVVSALDHVFTKMKVRSPENQELYATTAVALGRMGKAGAKVLKDAFGNPNFRKPEWVGLRGRLIMQIGATQDLGHANFILDTALRDPDDQIQARAGEALGNFEKVDLKTRRELVKKLLKRFVEIHNQSRSESLDDPIAISRQRTYAAIADPWNTTLSKLTGQTFRSPQDWERWWNNNKDGNWDASKG